MRTQNSKKIKINLNLIFYLLYFVISLCIFRRIIFAEYILTQETWPLYLENFKDIYLSNHSWIPQIGIPNVPMVLSFHCLFLFLAKILKMTLTRMIIIEYITLYAIAGIGMFSLVQYILKKKSRHHTLENYLQVMFSSFIAGVYYLFFPSFTITRYMRLEVVYGYVIAPLVFLFFMKSLMEKKVRYTIFSSILLSTIGFGERFYIFIPLMTGGYVLFSFLTCALSRREHIKRYLKNYFIPLVLFITLFFLLKIPAIFGTIMLKLSPGSVTTLSTDLVSVRFRYATPLNLTRGLGNIWVSTLFRNPPISSRFTSSISFVPILFALLPLALKNKKSVIRYETEVLFFTLVLIVFAFLFSNEFPIRDWLLLEAPLNMQIWRAFSSPKYQFFIGFSLSILLGMGTFKTIHKLSMLKFKKILCFGVLVFLFVSVVTPSWPLLTGDMNSALTPITLPQDYKVINEWLKDQSGYFKVLWLPQFGRARQPTWIERDKPIFDAFGIIVYGSSKPTYSLEYMPFSYFYKFAFSPVHDSLLHKGDIKNLETLLTILGIKYLIIHKDVRNVDVDKILQRILSNYNFKLVFSYGDIYVFENKKYTGRILVLPANSTFILWGGLAQAKSLVDCVETESIFPIIVGDSTMDVNKILETSYSKIVFTNYKNIYDLMIYYIPKNYLIAPAEYTKHFDLFGKNWSKAYLSDPHHGSWSSFINTLLGYNYKWEFSYEVNYGIIFATGKDTLEIPIYITEPGEYYILVRALKNPKGGKIEVDIGNLSKTIITKDPARAEFLWENLGKVWLNIGQQRLKIKNVEGHNAINLVIVIPEKEFLTIKDKVEKIIENKTIIYFLDAETDLYKINGDLAENENATNGKILYFYKGGIAWQYLDVIKSGTYKIALRASGKYIVRIKNDTWSKTFILNSTSLGFCYSPEFTLNKGKYKVEIVSLIENINLVRNPSFENGIKYWGPPKEGYTVTLDNTTKVDGNYSLKIIANNTLNDFAWIISQPFNVTPNTQYLVITHVKVKNVHGLHIPISYSTDYGKTWKRLTSVPRASQISPTSEWREYKAIIKTPENVTHLRIIINAGWVEDPEDGNAVTWVDDIIVYPLSSLPQLDTVVLYNVESHNKTIDQLFKATEEKLVSFISYYELNPAVWKVEVNVTAPFIILFAESYNSLWEARVYKNGTLVEKVSSILLYGVINGFWINETGNLTIIIRYKPQDWFELGLKISGTTLTLCVVYLFYDWRREKGDRWTTLLSRRMRMLKASVKRKTHLSWSRALNQRRFR